MYLKAFGLLELIVVMVIMGVTLYLVSPLVGNFMLNTRLRSAAESLLGAIHLASSEAIKRNDTVKFSALGGDGSWTISAYENTGYVTLKSQTGVPGVLVTAGELRFDSQGLPDRAMTFQVTSSQAACGDVTCLNILVFTSGQVRLCNPSSSSELISCS